MRPRIRTVKPEMRKDEKYGRMSYPARELFNGLITLADDEGRFLATTSAILGHVFPFDDMDAPRRLKAWIGEIKDSGMIVFYVSDSVPYGAFRHWKRHQKVNRPTPSVLPPPPNGEVEGENSVNDHGGFTESSVSDHGTLTASRVGARSDPNPVVVRLSERLGSKVLLNDPQFDTSKIHSDRWLEDMRLLLRDRGGDVAQIERVIDWTQADDFERANVLSPGKLRKRFTALLLKADRGNVVPLGRKETASDWLRDMDAEVIEAEVIEISNGETS